jgi:hypothetical protein
MNYDMSPVPTGTRVVRVGCPGIFGTVTGTQGRMVLVEWSGHFKQFIDPRKLIQVTQLPEPLARYVKREERFNERI